MKKSDVTKQKILKAAEIAFSEKGLYGARVDEITETAGVNKRMIYAYFGSKKKLYIAVLNMVYRRLTESEEKLLNQQSDCVETVKRIIAHYFTFLHENPTFVKMLMWENLNEGQYLKQSEAPEVKVTAVNLLKMVLKQGVQQGIFRDDLDLDELIVSINMFCFSYFSNIYTMAQIMKADLNRNDMVDKRCAHVTDIILRYILKEQE